MKIKRLLIIPARSGSKRIKNKNIKNFVGKPMIYYPINTAIKSKLFTKIHVSTNSKKISKLAESFGVMNDFYRPKNLSNDKASLFPVYKFVVNNYLLLGQKFDEVWCILPCSPFLDKNDLVIHSASADDGPVFKRFRPRSQGRGFKIKKPTCHIRVSLAKV